MIDSDDTLYMKASLHWSYTDPKLDNTIVASCLSSDYISYSVEKLLTY